MTSLSFKNVLISALFIWSIGLMSLIGSYFFSLIPNVAQQSIWLQSIALIPAALVGAHLYYRRGMTANGFLLGASIMLVMIGLDIILKVPAFLLPYGIGWGAYFSDFNYWLLGIEVVTVVAAYWQIERAVQKVQVQ
ncbi:MAG: hypothetical protein AAF544_12560 [Bacteroidota bacterium]